MHIYDYTGKIIVDEFGVPLELSNEWVVNPDFSVQMRMKFPHEDDEVVSFFMENSYRGRTFIDIITYIFNSFITYTMDSFYDRYVFTSPDPETRCSYEYNGIPVKIPPNIVHQISYKGNKSITFATIVAISKVAVNIENWKNDVDILLRRS